ncbi:MAG: hypothetical protein NTV76_06930 [Pseudomonas sp.]|nr:hypothetical protein [Pseudomonas sp.]
MIVIALSRNSWVSGRSSSVRARTGLAKKRQGAQFSVPSANFEAVFQLSCIKCSRLQALLCQALDGIGYDRGFELIAASI